MYEEYCKENYDLRRGMNTKIKEKKKKIKKEKKGRRGLGYGKILRRL